MSNSNASVADKLRIALQAIDYLPNAVSAWVEAHGGNYGLTNSNAKKLRQAQDLLSEVLASLPVGGVEYMVLGLDKDVLRFKTREDLVAGLAAKGYSRLAGDSGTSLSGLRAELQGQPRFSGLVGPMYGGPGVARYETGKVYDAMSQ